MYPDTLSERVRADTDNHGMQQEALFIEDINEAIRTTVQALGGAKKVGADLWPTLSVDAAGNRLRDAMNPGRREHLSPEEIIAIAKMGRASGCHALTFFFCREAGYADPQPVDPEDQRAELQREFVDGVRRLEQIAKQIQAVPAVRGVRR